MDGWLAGCVCMCPCLPSFCVALTHHVVSTDAGWNVSLVRFSSVSHLFRLLTDWLVGWFVGVTVFAFVASLLDRIARE